MPKPMQAKLLRVVQDGVVRRVGSEALGAKVDVRVIAATNRDPTAAIAAGLLREDLYYRLHVVPLHLPPLRERREDIPMLAGHFLRYYWVRHRGAQAALPVLTPEALNALAAHPWRGNVRELQNTMEHLVVILEPGARISASDLPLCEWPSQSAAPHARPVAHDFSGGYRAARQRVLADFEASYVAWFEGQAGRNLSRAARQAGIERTTLYRLLGRQARRGERS
jgi:transcriptional regulator with PAS, ATPase and Fis domain